MKPDEVVIRMYNVGHGDCFLLSFRYRRESRHLLIDFGTLQPNRREERCRLMPVAADIASRCTGGLHAVVATHAHRDHIGGFEKLHRQKAPGNIIAKLHPQLILHPAIPPVVHHLDAIYSVLTGTQYSNHRALENLRQCGKSVNTYTGQKTGLGRLFPGVRFHILGPRPQTVNPSFQDHSILDADTHRLLSFWTTQHQALLTSRNRPLFPHAEQVSPRLAPASTRWFIERLNHLRNDQLLQLAEVIHTEINNSSIILMIETGRHQLLFPGDAEKSAWSFVLKNPAHRNLLSATTVYKASHHGSLNGTPDALKQLFSPSVITLLSARDKKTENPLGEDAPALDTRLLKHGHDPAMDLILE